MESCFDTGLACYRIAGACPERRLEVPRDLRMLRGAMWIRVALLTILLAGLGCDSRSREIRSQLSDDELQRFQRGQQVSSPCWSCHDFYGKQNKIGPYLSGVYGRPAGGAEWGGYSPAMRESEIVWSDETLAAYVSAPQQTVPGTTMVSDGVRGQDLEALLFWMRLVTAEDDDG